MKPNGLCWNAVANLREKAFISRPSVTIFTKPNAIISDQLRKFFLSITPACIWRWHHLSTRGKTNRENSVIPRFVTKNVTSLPWTARIIVLICISIVLFVGLWQPNDLRGIKRASIGQHEVMRLGKILGIRFRAIFFLPNDRGNKVFSAKNLVAHLPQVRDFRISDTNKNQPSFIQQSTSQLKPGIHHVQPIRMKPPARFRIAGDPCPTFRLPC